MLATIDLLIRRRKHQMVNCFLQFVSDSEQNLSPILFQSVVELVNQDKLVDETTRYNAQQMAIALELISDLQPGLKHHSIHCLSFRECMSTVIGLNMPSFSKLFLSLREPLARAFPRCPETLAPGEVHNFCERRFRLFLCLFRLKQGVTFAQMEVTFGWSTSVLQEWFDIVLRILVRYMHCFHEGFLAYKGNQWQMNELTKWHAKHYKDGSVNAYHSKIAFQNSESRRVGGGDTIDGSCFIGSIGAVDGTYCVQPRVGVATLVAHASDPELDVMWSEYKRCHAYKVVLVNSHGFDGEPKFLLWVSTACGSASDAAVYSTIVPELSTRLIREAALLGDNAFHGAIGVIAPYTTAQINASAGANLSAFNHNHSSDRMTSEHGVRSFKLWGVGRGREDSRLFQNEEYFVYAIKAIWALHNYKECACPIF
jgi:hypothetical protein